MRETEPHHLSILGSDVHYWVYNEDKPHTIVMIHGLRGTHHGLHEIIRALPEYRVIIPDLPGFGQSTPMLNRHHDVAGYSEFVRQFVRQLQPTAKPTLLGHSFGSIIAASVAATSPELFDELILLNPIASLALTGPRALMGLGPKFYYSLGAALPERSGRALLSNRLVVRLTSDFLTKTKDKALKATIRQRHREHFSSFQTREALLEAFNASISHTVAEYARDIHLPTLLVAGAIDDVAPLKGQFTLEKQLPDARLIIIDSVGHLIHHEAPKETAEAIRDFMA